MGEVLHTIERSDDYIDHLHYPEIESGDELKVRQLTSSILEKMQKEISIYDLAGSPELNLPYHDWRHTFGECVPAILEFYAELKKVSPGDISNQQIYEGVLAMAGHDLVQIRELSGDIREHESLSSDDENRLVESAEKYGENERQSADMTRQIISITQHSFLEGNRPEIFSGDRLAAIENAIIGTTPTVSTELGLDIHPTVPVDEDTGEKVIVDKAIFGPVVQVDLGAHGLMGEKVFLEHGRRLIMERLPVLKHPSFLRANDDTLSELIDLIRKGYQEQVSFVENRLKRIPGEVAEMFPSRLVDIATVLLSKHSKESLEAAEKIAHWSKGAEPEELIHYTYNGPED